MIGSKIYLEVARRLGNKLVAPRHLFHYLNYRVNEGNEYFYHDFATLFPFLARVIDGATPIRLAFDQPVFLLGLRRTGTTLFYRIMNAHSGIQLFNERFPGDRMNAFFHSTKANVWSIADAKEFRRTVRMYLNPLLKGTSQRWISRH